MPDHPFGWWSLAPPTVAIVAAIASRRVLTSLLAGVLVGIGLLTFHSPPQTIVDALMLPVTAAEQHLWSPLVEASHLRILAFTLLMAAMVGVVAQSGGMQSVVRGLASLARGRTGGQLITWLLGLIVFFDDYANTLLVGHTMRPLSDRLRISRQKLAYLVDSTAAPVAGVAIVSTWVAAEIGYIEDGMSLLPGGDTLSGFEIFVKTIPYRFYVLLALIMVPLVGIMGRDFGPMWHAERNAARSASPATYDAADVTREAGHWLTAIAPIGIMVAITLLLLVGTGYRAATASQTDFTVLRALASGDSHLALLYGALTGLIVAVVAALSLSGVDGASVRQAVFAGARSVVPALAILWLAWSLSAITSDEYLGTATFLGRMLETTVPITWMPTLVFLLSAAIAFATGTSWGTMAIVTPLSIRSTYAMLSGDAAAAPTDPLMLATIGSVLAGATFGDHASPISDTTVLSSQASGCDLIEHVRTQLPYALLVAGVSIVCGTLPVGYGAPAWALLPAGVLLLALALRFCGRRLDD